MLQKQHKPDFLPMMSKPQEILGLAFPAPTSSSGGAERAALAMSTIEEVRAAEKRVQKASDAFKNAPAEDPNHLADQLAKATDEYARAVRELRSK